MNERKDDGLLKIKTRKKLRGGKTNGLLHTSEKSRILAPNEKRWLTPRSQKKTPVEEKRTFSSVPPKEIGCFLPNEKR